MIENKLGEGTSVEQLRPYTDKIDRFSEPECRDYLKPNISYIWGYPEGDTLMDFIPVLVAFDNEVEMKNRAWIQRYVIEHVEDEDLDFWIAEQHQNYIKSHKKIIRKNNISFDDIQYYADGFKRIFMKYRDDDEENGLCIAYDNTKISFKDIYFKLLQISNELKKEMPSNEDHFFKTVRKSAFDYRRELIMCNGKVKNKSADDLLQYGNHSL